MTKKSSLGIAAGNVGQEDSRQQVKHFLSYGYQREEKEKDIMLQVYLRQLFSFHFRCRHLPVKTTEENCKLRQVSSQWSNMTDRTEDHWQRVAEEKWKRCGK